MPLKPAVHLPATRRGRWCCCSDCYRTLTGTIGGGPAVVVVVVVVIWVVAVAIVVVVIWVVAVAIFVVGVVDPIWFEGF